MFQQGRLLTYNIPPTTGMRIFSLNVPDEYIDEGRSELNILIPVVGGNTSVNVPVETKETEAIMLLFN